MNFKEWHKLMKDEDNRPSQDISRRYQEKYIREHPLTNKIYTGMNNFFNNLEEFRKKTY